jgi:hypothetical protein
VLAVADLVDEPAAAPRRPPLRRPSRATLLETLLVLASPVLLFLVLRLRAMAPDIGPDPSMHTAYIVDPRDFFARFSSELASQAGTREGARVGFLVPARLSYLVFGAVPGFFVFRYLLALVAIVPAYILLRRLYGKAAGVVAIVILMSSPVLVTAWGTDYPDSAVVSYLTGGLACLAMPCTAKRRGIWLAIAAGLFTMAVWSNVVAASLVAATMVVYGIVCFRRSRRRLLADALVLGGTAAGVTGALMLASGVLLGPVDYILPTIRSFGYLSRPAVVHHFHSTNPRWILIRPYLLVPVAVVGAWGATSLRRLSAVPTSQLLIGWACVAQVAAFGYLQFFGNFEVLQQHYYSSNLWGAVCLVLAITVAALAKPLLDHRVARWLPALLVLGVPLLYEADPHLPRFGWVPIGLLIAAGMIAAVVVGRLVSSRLPAAAKSSAAGAIAVAVMAVCIGGPLILSVAPYEHHGRLPGVIDNPAPAYATALGGRDGILIDKYRVATELPRFVGNSTYHGEGLLMWFPLTQIAHLIEVMGIYHANINELASSPPVLTARDTEIVAARKPAEILVFDTPNFPATLRALARYKPTFLRATVLKSGDYAVHAWLISLGVFMARGPT